MIRKRKAAPMEHSRVVDHIKLCIRKVMNNSGDAREAIEQSLGEAMQVVDLVLDKGTDNVDAYSMDVLQSAFGSQDHVFQDVCDALGDLGTACLAQEVRAMERQELVAVP